MDNCTSGAMSDVSQINMPPGISEKSSTSLINKTDQFCNLLQNLIITNHMSEFARSAILDFSTRNQLFAETANIFKKHKSKLLRIRPLAGGIKLCTRTGCGCLADIAKPGKYEKVLTKEDDMIIVTSNGKTTKEAMDIECPCLERNFRSYIVPALEVEEENVEESGTERPGEQEISEYEQEALPSLSTNCPKYKINDSSEEDGPEEEQLEEGNIEYDIDNDYDEDNCEFIVQQMKRNPCVETAEDMLFILELYKLNATNNACIRYGIDYIQEKAPDRLKNIGPSQLVYLFVDAHIDKVKGKTSEICNRYRYDEILRLNVYNKMKAYIMKMEDDKMDTTE